MTKSQLPTGKVCQPVGFLCVRCDLCGKEAISRRYQSHNPLLSFRMISDTRIEYRNANSRRETARFRPTGSYGSGVKPRGTGSIGVDGLLRSLPQCGPHLPSLRHQPPDVLSLATAL